MGSNPSPISTNPTCPTYFYLRFQVTSWGEQANTAISESQWYHFDGYIMDLIIKSPFSHGFPWFSMIFPWFSHGFPMVFPWFSMVSSIFSLAQPAPPAPVSQLFFPWSGGIGKGLWRCHKEMGANKWILGCESNWMFNWLVVWNDWLL